MITWAWEWLPLPLDLDDAVDLSARFFGAVGLALIWLKFMLQGGNEPPAMRLPPPRRRANSTKTRVGTTHSAVPKVKAALSRRTPKRMPERRANSTKTRVGTTRSAVPKVKAASSRRTPKRMPERRAKTTLRAAPAQKPNCRVKPIKLEHAVFWQDSTGQVTPLMSWGRGASVPTTVVGRSLQNRIAALFAANRPLLAWVALIVLVVTAGATRLFEQVREHVLRGHNPDSRQNRRTQSGKTQLAAPRIVLPQGAVTMPDEANAHQPPLGIGWYLLLTFLISWAASAWFN